MSDKDDDGFLVATTQAEQHEGGDTDKNDRHEEKVTDTNDHADDSSAEPSKKKGGYQKRIDELVKERETERREKEAERAKREELEQKLKQLESGDIESKDDAEDEIDPADYDTYADYEKALEEARAAKSKPKQEPPKADEEEFDPQTKAACDAILESVESWEEKPEDFEDVAYAQDVAITADMMQVIAELENPAKIVYLLGCDKDHAKEIAKMTPVKRMKALAALDNQPLKPVKKAASTRNNKPDPFEPLQSGETDSRGGVDLDKAPFRDFERARNRAEGSRWD